MMKLILTFLGSGVKMMVHRLILLILLIPVFCQADIDTWCGMAITTDTTINGATLGSIGGVDVASGGDDYSDILLHYDAENSLNLDIGSVTGSNSGMSFDNTIYKTSSYSLKRDSNYDHLDFTISTSHFEKAGGQLGFWWYNESGHVTGSSCTLLRFSDGTNNTFSVSLNYPEGLKAAWSGNGSASYATYSTALATSTWFYVVVYWQPGAAGNDLVLTIYDTSGDTEGTASVGGITAMDGDPTGLVFGNATADAVRFRIDNYVISNNESRNMWGINDETSF